MKLIPLSYTITIKNGGELEFMVQRKKKAEEGSSARKKSPQNRPREAGSLNKEPASQRKIQASHSKTKQQSTEKHRRKIKEQDSLISDSSKRKREPVRESVYDDDGGWEKLDLSPKKKAVKKHVLKAKEEVVPPPEIRKRPAKASKDKKKPDGKTSRKPARQASKPKQKRSYKQVKVAGEKKEFRLQVLLTGLAIILGAVILFGLIMFGMSVGKGLVNGNSMSPTLEDKEKVIFLRYEKIDQFDIVAFRPPNHPDEQYVKRVIGLPGDNVSYQKGVLKINGKEADEEYVVYEDTSDKEHDFELEDIIDRTDDISGTKLREVNEIPEDMYLVMGDNRSNSEDSRTFGLIKSDTIIGVVRFRYSPMSKIGIVR